MLVRIVPARPGTVARYAGRSCLPASGATAGTRCYGFGSAAATARANSEAQSDEESPAISLAVAVTARCDDGSSRASMRLFRVKRAQARVLVVPDYRFSAQRTASPWQGEASTLATGQSPRWIHAMTAARRAAWSGTPFAFARLSKCLQTLAGKRTDRGTVGPVSVPFLGLPRPAWMEIPSFAIRSAYGLRRTLALSKSTSGISRSDARVGSRAFLPVAFFMAFPLMGCSASRADDADQVLGLLDEDNEQNTSLLGLTDQDRALRVQC